VAEPGLRLIDRVAETAAAELTGAQGEAAARRLRRRGALAAGAAALLAVAATVFALGDPGPVAPPNDPGTGPPVDPGTGTALTGVRTPGTPPPAPTAGTSTSGGVTRTTTTLPAGLDDLTGGVLNGLLGGGGR
jgi:hypothetical protein